MKLRPGGRNGIAIVGRILAAGLCGLVLASSASFALAAQRRAPARMRVMITTRAPDPAKWTASTAADGTGRVFRCKPHACPAPATVTFTFRKGPFKRPDAKALQKFATVELPKAIRAGAVARTVMTGVVERIETLSSKAATLKNYPAALNETKFTRNGVRSAFLDTGVIFAGPLIIRVESASSNRGLAHKLLNDFIDVMRIVEVPLPPPGRPFRQPPKTQSL
jgi:hypothetical protein